MRIKEAVLHERDRNQAGLRAHPAEHLQRPDAIKYRDLTKDRLLELGVSFVDIDGINPEGLLYDDKDVAPILEKFRKEQVDGLFVPHCNFGTEYVVARLARELGVPVLL